MIITDRIFLLLFWISKVKAENPINNAPNISNINFIAISGLFTAILPELMRKAIIPEKKAKYSRIFVLLSLRISVI